MKKLVQKLILSLVFYYKIICCVQKNKKTYKKFNFSFLNLLYINYSRDQMLTYAQEIDQKLANCKDSRNKYYQICQQLTAKYSKLKVLFFISY